MVAISKDIDASRRPSPVKCELYREQCQDEDGNRYTVIVWKDWPGSPLTSYTLEDGTALHYEYECYFATPAGKMLTRCED